MGYHLQICCRQAQKNADIAEQLSKQNSMLIEKYTLLEEKFTRMEALVSEMSLGKFRQSPILGTSSTSLSEGAAMASLAGPQQLETLRQVTVSQEKRLNSVERTVALHDVQLTETGIRQDLEEVKTTNGVFIWKISNFQQRQQEAISGRAPSIYSPPFFTSPAGYKVCARLYPNGDGVGRGTHLSLFFVVMKGEYDALLPWPFQQKVSLVLLDQSPINRKDIVETFRPDPNSTSFQRPEQEMNVASGCPLFLSLSALKHGSYLRNNTLFFKIIVHPQGLVAPDQI